MQRPEKACPVVIRHKCGSREMLAFRHPSGGRQFVKGSIKPGETAAAAAARELWEESGITAHEPVPLGSTLIGDPLIRWYFVLYQSGEARDTWTHATTDDFGHVYSFFWHPLDIAPDTSWHSSFVKAWEHISLSLTYQHNP